MKVGRSDVRLRSGRVAMGLIPAGVVACSVFGSSLDHFTEGKGGGTCPDGGCAEECLAPKLVCGAECVDTQTDDQHCGKCNENCAVGQKCAAGKCVASCSATQKLCDGACVDPQTNQNHCGDCGKACPGGQVCSAGQCEIACPGGQSECSGLCYDLQSDDQHCGSCTTVCAAGEVCGNGQCGLTCPTGQDNCGGSCVDLQTNSQHCGVCGTACGSNEECVAGKCAIACKTLLNQAINDPWGYSWDGLERAATAYDQAKTTCETNGGRLPTASELFRVSATQSATVGQTTHVNYLWSAVPAGPTNQIRVRLSDASTTIVASTSSLNYRCVCPPPLPSSYTGKNCFGPVASSCAALDSDGKKTNVDSQDRPPLPKSSAIWECGFYRGHLASSARLIETILSVATTGTNTYLHTADDARTDSDLILRWTDPKSFDVTSGANLGTTSSLRPFRCVGPNYDAGTHPASIPGEWVGPLGGYKADGADAAAATWTATSDACWALGGHVPTATELAEMATQGLVGGANAYLWTSDQSMLQVSLTSSIALQTFRWSTPTQPTYASGTDLSVSAKNASLPSRCIYYPVDTAYTGPGASCTQCKELALPGTSGAKMWIDGLDRLPSANLHAAFNACRQLGGRLASGRDIMEGVRHQLGDGSGQFLWVGDFVYRYIYLGTSALHGAVAKWIGTELNYSDLPGTNTDTAVMTTNHPYRCMWTNEMR